MPFSVLLSCKMAVMSGTAAGLGSTAYQCFRPQPRGSTRPFRRGETADVLTAFAVGAAVGTVASVAVIPLSMALHATVWDGVQSALVTTAVLSPLYASTIVNGNQYAAAHLPLMIAGTALVAGGSVIGLGLLSELIHNHNFIISAGGYQACFISAGLGLSGFGVFHFTNRYATGSRYALANTGRNDVCGEIGTYLLQALGNVAAYIMFSSAVTLRRPVINPIIVSWIIIDLALLMSAPPQPSLLSPPGADGDNLDRYCDYIKRWWILAGLSLVAVSFFPVSPLSWMIASQIYMDYQQDWNSLCRLEDGGRPLGGGATTGSDSGRSWANPKPASSSSWWDSDDGGHKVGGNTPEKHMTAAELRARAAEQRMKKESDESP